MKKDNSEMLPLSLDDLNSVSGGAAGESVVTSGSFTSNTGTALNIQVDWSVVKTLAGTKELKVSVSTWSYSLNSISLEKGVELTVNGALYCADSAAINYGGQTQASNLLASFSIPNLSGTVNLSAVWHFRGSYSGVELNDIRVEGTVTV